MSAVSKAARLLEQIAQPVPVGDTLKAAVNRIALKVNAEARRLGMDPIKLSRIDDVLRGEARRIESDEMDLYRATAKSCLADKEQPIAREIDEIRKRLALVEAEIARMGQHSTGKALRQAFEGVRDLGGILERQTGRAA